MKVVGAAYEFLDESSKRKREGQVLGDLGFGKVRRAQKNERLCLKGPLCWEGVGGSPFSSGVVHLAVIYRIICRHGERG